MPGNSYKEAHIQDSEDMEPECMAAPCRQRHLLCCREWAAQKEREALQAAARAGQADHMERHLRHLQQQLAEAVSELGHCRQLQLDLAGKRWCLRLSKAAAAIWLAVHTHWQQCERGCRHTCSTGWERCFPCRCLGGEPRGADWY